MTYICRIIFKSIMINRRLIRIKVFKVLYSSVFSDSFSVPEAEKELKLSCSQTLNLYYLILNLMVSIKRAAETRIDNGLRKYQPTQEELSPNLKFIENQFTEYLEKDEKFIKYCEKNALLWAGDDGRLVRKILAGITEQEYFKEYMSSAERSIAQDCELWADILTSEIAENEEIEDLLEEKSVYWMDELTYVVNVILKSLDIFKIRKKIVFPDMFLKEDDRDFAFRLLSSSMMHYHEYIDVVTSNVANWDSDRIVATDTILIAQGLSEAVSFPEIPVKVTINEYVEISKFYSTQNSRIFVNGLLDKLIQKFLSDGRIVKEGRGLRES